MPDTQCLLLFQDLTFTDVSNAGFATTLGVASFHEQMNNKIDLEVAKTLVRRGRPKKVRKQESCLQNTHIASRSVLACLGARATH
jgi:hypothetical protein